jgi:biopolymer transport protein TolR
MAMSAGGAAGGGRRRGRGRPRRGALSEINVTPLVDVMLVLLIIFMISAPLLTVGVPVDLPKTEAGAVEDSAEPVSVTIRKDGALFLQEGAVEYDSLIEQVSALTQPGGETPIFVRADGGAPYESVARVMAKLSSSGFTRLNLITDTAAPGAGPEAPTPELRPAVAP